MSAYRTKTATAALVFALLAGPVLAENAPLALLPTGSGEPAPNNTVVIAPSAMGLALPVPVTAVLVPPKPAGSAQPSPTALSTSAPQSAAVGTAAVQPVTTETTAVQTAPASTPAPTTPTPATTVGTASAQPPALPAQPITTGTASSQPAPAVPPALTAPATTAQAPQPAPVGTAAVQPTQSSAAVPPATSVETAPLKDIKADSIGLLRTNEGGLGAGMWKGTSRALVARFLPMLNLPLPYASLNNLAGRFLLTTAATPEGSDEKGQPNLTAIRVDKLVALGYAAEAWKLASTTPDQIDDTGMRQVAEAALVSPVAADVCAKLPELIKQHTAIEWQKLLVVCQLRAGDTKAAQVSLDLLHAQDVHDDSFFTLAEKNVIAGNKQLPRQLTPLKPLLLALLRLSDLPLRAEIYARPDAALIPELLKAKTLDEAPRLALAERAAMKGLISANDLADVYKDQPFTAETIINALNSTDQGPLLHALLFQASQIEKEPRKRVHIAGKFLANLDATNMGGAMLPVLGMVMGDAQPAVESFEESAAAVNISMLSGKGNQALLWLDLAHNAARGFPQVAAALVIQWPMQVLTGVESEKDFAKDLDTWLAASLHDPNATDPDTKAQKTKITSLMLFMDALGFSIPDDAWAKVGDTALSEKILMPPTIVLERLRMAAGGNRKGEAILMGMLASMGGKEDPPFLATVATVRALRAVGLASDAGNLAKEAALRIMYPPAKP